MKTLYRTIALAALAGQALMAGPEKPRGYIETDLVVNQKVDATPMLVDSNGNVHIAKFADENLKNPWGIAKSATSAFWVANGTAGRATLYNTAGTPQPLVVSIPTPSDPLG